MRIAVSGTHCRGKSTFIDAFLTSHSQYTHEPEAYAAMEDRGEVFSAEPSADDFIRQLEYCVNCLDQFGPGDCVIFERSPADYLAYLIALEKLDRDPDARLLKERSLELARRGMQNIDIVVFLRLTIDLTSFLMRRILYLEQQWILVWPEILLDNDLNLVDGDHPSIVEALGSTAETIEALNAALFTHTHSKANSTRLLI